MKKKANSVKSYQLIILILFFVLPVSLSARLSVEKCIICHGKLDFRKVDETGKVKELYIDLKEIEYSVHKKKTCVECHSDVVEIPHKESPKRVVCIRCHYKGNPDGAPQSDKYLEYQRSVHGRASAAGKKNAPFCQDCHGNHNIKHTKDISSFTYKLNIPKTCGKCHIEIYAEYSKSVHGYALIQKGVIDAPACTDCHGEHNIIEHINSESKVYGKNLIATCGRCHNAVEVVGKYGISVEQIETFERTFHGIAVKYNSKTAANCASCHGVHNILSSLDPNSSININNIPKTCGKPECHPNANINFAKGKIHINPHKRSSGIVFYTAFFFKYLTIFTMLGLIVHIILDLSRRSKEWREKKKI